MRSSGSQKEEGPKPLLKSCPKGSPLADDHPVAGVGRLHRGVDVAVVVAGSAYGPVESVAVVDVGSL
jgi:hypothetical protein